MTLYNNLSNTVRSQKNGAVSKVNKKFISHLTRAQRTPSAATTVQVSYVRFWCLLRGHKVHKGHVVAIGKKKKKTHMSSTGSWATLSETCFSELYEVFVIKMNTYFVEYWLNNQVHCWWGRCDLNTEYYQLEAACQSRVNLGGRENSSRCLFRTHKLRVPGNVAQQVLSPGNTDTISADKP
jgi:hypothetical protein